MRRLVHITYKVQVVYDIRFHKGKYLLESLCFTQENITMQEQVDKRTYTQNDEIKRKIEIQFYMWLFVKEREKEIEVGQREMIMWDRDGQAKAREEERARER